MSKAKIAIIGLSVALVISNCWWAYVVYDQMITRMYQDDSFKTSQRALKQCLRLLPIVAKPNITRDEVVAAAQEKNGSEPFEKEGYLWVDELGLKFDEKGHLTQVVPGTTFAEDE